jgi:hypothetical protein
VSSKDSCFADDANDNEREENSADSQICVKPNVASANVDLASDESMEEVPIEVTRSGGILINDIDMEHNDESNEDEGKDEEVGLVAAVPVVQSERDSDSKSHEQQGKPAVAHKDRTRGDTSSVEQGRALQQKRWLIWLVMSFVVIILAVVVPCALLLPKNNNTTESDQLGASQIYIMRCLFGIDN